MIIGALEAGGTKMVCAYGDESGRIMDQISIPTLTPDKTLSECLEYFADKHIEALGIACFGPVDLRKNSTAYGHITSTPKPDWGGTDVVGFFKKSLGVPVGFDTDVNGSLLGEVTYGAARGLTDVVYFTIGTGVGAGIMSGGKLVHGMMHPEAGHMLLSKHINDTYKGRCPYHENCFEGLAAGPAIEERWGDKAINLSGREDVWEMESYYIAQAMVNVIVTLSPQRIILGGGVMHQEQLFPLIREKTADMLNGYIRSELLEDMNTYIVPASLHDDQGIMGCIKLALDEMEAGR